MGSPHLRLMTRSDIKRVMKIDRESYPHPWSANWFTDILDDEDFEVQVAEIEGEVVGFIVVHHTGTKVSIARLAVAEEHRRNGVGTFMLCEYDDLPLQTFVRANNLPAQHFLRYNDFKAKRVLKSAAKYPIDDVYMFVKVSECMMELRNPVVLSPLSMAA